MRKNPLSLVKKDTSAVSPFEDFEKRFEEFWHRPFEMMRAPWWPWWGEREYEVSPTVDIYEDGDHVVLKAEIPGMKKEDIHVDITEKTVTISGEKHKEEKVERKDYYHHERSYGSFARTFHLPWEVKTDKVEAHFKDGILEVRAPKTEEAARKSRKVVVQ
ncbi:MAG: Hsp20/alpha crystallin family protein [Thermodesulfobacteriota bacterium]